MADEISTLRRLQAGLNANFEAIYATAENDPTNLKAIAAAKEELISLSDAIIGTALGPAMFVLSMSRGPVSLMAIRIAIDLNIFEIIASKKEPTSLQELAEKTKADPTIINRIIRLVNAMGFVKQTDVTSWESTPLTHTINVPALRSFFVVHYDKRLETWDRFPAWLKRHDYKTTWAGDDDNVTFEVLGTSFWGYFNQNPEASAAFDSAMSLQEMIPPEMIPPYPFFEDTTGLKTGPDAVTLVDIGGGAGQAVGSIRSMYPNIPGKFIVQDLPSTIEPIAYGRATELGFEPMVYNFFEPQPIKGAKYYHLRRILHDWNDEKSLKILESTIAAMDSSYSRLLIHDYVIPDVNCGAVEAMLDLMMMTFVDGKERTERDWQELLSKAGFKIVKIHRAEVGTASVIEAAVA